MNDRQEHLQEPELAIPKVKGVKHEPFLDWIRNQTCMRTASWQHCDVGYSDPHHVRGRRHGDIANVVPLCRVHHTEGHKIGWQTWQKKHGINLLERAAWYWWRFCERSEQ